MSVLRDLLGPGTWGLGGNLLAGVLTAAAVWPLRHRIGARLAAWWATHHGPHAIAQHREALRQHDEQKRSRM